MVGGARQRGRGHQQKTLRLALLGIALEDRRLDKPVHRRMFRRRLQILADGHEIHIRASQVIHQLADLLVAFAKPHHDAGLGEDQRVELLDLLQDRQRVEIARAGPDRRVEAWARLAKDLTKSALDAATSVIGLSDVPAAGADILAGRVRGRLVVDLSR